jgi:hypothetical protein
VRLEGLGQLKNPMISTGMEPVTLRLVAWGLNQLRYRVSRLAVTIISKERVQNIQTCNCEAPKISAFKNCYIGHYVTSTGSFSVLHNQDTFGENSFPVFEVLMKVHICYLLTNFGVLLLGNVLWCI